MALFPEAPLFKHRLSPTGDVLVRVQCPVCGRFRRVKSLDGEQEVIPNTEIGEQIGDLKGATKSQSSALVRCGLGHVLIKEEDPPGIGTKLTAQDIEQCRLSRAI